MNQTLKSKLPPNPYRRSPIKKRGDLAGRERELKTIRYYLNLTVSGQSPHLALIGQRGVGKTSLLNGAESIARDLKLLPVRLDMNELKAQSPGRFWHDLYQTLGLAMVKADCWGGLHGPVYAEMLRLLHAPGPGNLQGAVLQLPYLFSCSQGRIDTFECPDALIISDFEACINELAAKDLAGIILLIDEADCLGKNVALLQMFRNIFQVVDHCSLMLAGTEAVFPALSEVFSPIPRQFHRIEVKPFANWLDTLELVKRPLPKEVWTEVEPELDVIRELHALCGGAPDEVQLYCHHIYRSIEDGSSTKIALSPQVFRAVLHEYRSNTPSNVDAVLNAIERLPDKLLYRSKWLRRRAISLDENILLTILRLELKFLKSFSDARRTKIANALRSGYKTLFDKGIIEKSDQIKLVGAPLTSGFWKSFVEVERSRRWTWNDGSFTENLRTILTCTISRMLEARAYIISQSRQSLSALQMLREGRIPTDFDDEMSDLVVSALIARDLHVTHVLDINFQLTSQAGKQTLCCRFFERPERQLCLKQFQEWIEINQPILAAHNIVLFISDCNRLQLPSSGELHRLAHLSDSQLPDEFGPSQFAQAFGMFEQGDLQGCMRIFSEMLNDKEEADVRNNLGFCQILGGDVASGLINVTKAMQMEYEPLYELNRGVAEFLQNDAALAKTSLRSALERYQKSDAKYEPNHCYVLVLPSTEGKLGFYDLPIDVAILLNLYRIGDIEQTQIEKEIRTLYPDNADNWLATLNGAKA